METSRGLQNMFWRQNEHIVNKLNLEAERKRGVGVAFPALDVHTARWVAVPFPRTRAHRALLCETRQTAGAGG